MLDSVETIQSQVHTPSFEGGGCVEESSNRYVICEVDQASAEAAMLSLSPEVLISRDCENVDDYFDICGYDQCVNPNWVNMCQEGDRFIGNNCTGESLAENACELVYKNITGRNR